MNLSWRPSPGLTNTVTLCCATSRLSRLLGGAAGCVLLVIAWRQGVEAYATHMASGHSTAGLSAAAELAPGNADLWREMALAVASSNSLEAVALLNRAIEVNPLDSKARVALGVLAESAGNIDEAEAHFRDAAISSRRMKPRLALAAFYGRQGPIGEFWRAANSAAAVESADLKPLFVLAHAVVSDPAEVAAKLQLNSQRAVTSYLEFLLGRPEPTPLTEYALRLTPSATNRTLLLSVTDRLLQEGAPSKAMRVWNAMYPRSIDPLKDRFIVNPRFDPGDGSGFDWRHAPTYGIDLRRAPGDLRVEFSGRQAEQVVLLEQQVPVLARRFYRLSWKATMNGSALRPGLSWRVGRSRVAPIAAAPDASGAAIFETEADETLVRLALQYSRPPGETRLDGVVTVQSVELKPK